MLNELEKKRQNTNLEISVWLLRMEGVEGTYRVPSGDYESLFCAVKKLHLQQKRHWTKIKLSLIAE